jgi:hypothetical protein
MFQQHFKDLLKKCGVIRFMDKQNTNDSNVAFWSDRTPVGHYQYNSAQPGNCQVMPSAHTFGMATQQSLTGLNSLNYTIKAPGFTLTDRVRIICHFPAQPDPTFARTCGITSLTPSPSPHAVTTIGINTNPGYISGQKVFIGAIATNPQTSTLWKMLSWRFLTIVESHPTYLTVTLDDGGDTYNATGTYSRMWTNHSINPILYLSIDASAAGDGSLMLGPIPIGDEFGTPYGEGYRSAQGLANPVLKISKGQYNCLTYDATTKTFCANSGQQTGNNGISGGWPPEICVRLCNDIGAHPWFCIPTLACDASEGSGENPGDIGNLPGTAAGDCYATKLAEYCRDNLKPGLIPRFEPSNEVWNTQTIGAHAAWRQFIKNKRCTTYNASTSYSEQYAGWYGQAVAQIGKAVSDVYGGDMAKYRMIAGWQLGSGGWAGTSQEPRLTSPAYVELSGNDETKRAYKWATHIGGAPYWQLGLYNTNYEINLANQYYASPDISIVEEYVSSANAEGLTSGTPNDIVGSGTVTWTTTRPVASILAMKVGDQIRAACAEDTAGNVTYMEGTLKYYNGTTLRIDVSGSHGSGRYSYWTIPAWHGHFSSCGYEKSGSLSSDSVIPNIRTWWASAYAFGATFTNNAGNHIGICAYEGGAQIKIGGQGHIPDLQAAAEYGQATQLYDCTRTVWNDMLSQGPLAEFPCEYIFTGYAIWSIFVPDTYGTPSSRWQALLDFG